MTITVSTDGSALGNPNGPMGWAWADHATNAARTDGHQHDGDSDAGGATNGTNQIGELCAVLEALRAHRGAEPLTIETDSQYAINCSTTWVRGWKKNGWRNSQKKPVKNAPLIKAIDAEISRRQGPVKFVWVKGHNGNPGNEKVDDLAHTYSGDARSGVKDGYLPLEGWQSLLASPYAKGVDIPADAKMLINGKITEEQYHLGRGAEPGDGDSDNSDDSEGNENQTSNSGQNTENSDDTDENQIASGNENSPAGSQNAGKTTLSERLTEPEGVPDYDFNHHKPTVEHRGAAENDKTTDENNNHRENSDASGSHTNGHTVRSHPDFSASQVGDDITIPANRNHTVAAETELPAAKTTAQTQPGHPAATSTSKTQQPAGNTSSEGGTDSNETDEAGTTPNNKSSNDANAADGSDNDDTENKVTDDESAKPVESTESSKTKQSNDGATATIALKAPEIPKKPEPMQNGRAQANPEPEYLPSGLSVSGPIRFFPAPQTSPTYNGMPRHIRGVIAVDGYVAGDGTIVLSNAPFLIANNAGK